MGSSDDPKIRAPRRGCFSRFLIWSLVFILVSGSVFGVYGWLQYRNYLDWRGEYFSNMQVVLYSDLKSEFQRESLAGKIEEYSGSSEDVDFMELTYPELVTLLYDEIDSALPDDVSLRDLGVKYNRDGEISVLLDMEYREAPLPWIEVVMKKDPYETAEIYSTAVNIGGNERMYISRRIMRSVNDSYRDTLLLVNENGFTGRTFDNIEIESRGITIKGTLNP